MAYLTNSFGRVVDIPEDQVKKKLNQGDFRIATQDEIRRMKAQQASLLKQAEFDGNSVYYQTVPSSPDGYGMSRDILKNELFKLKVNLSEFFADQKIGLLYNYPYGVVQMKTPVRLIYTMFESDKIPDDWPEYLEMADEVLVPSAWCQEVFAKSGIESTVVPLGYDSETFTYQERQIPFKNDQEFVFIHYDSFNIRKGFSEVFTAFTEEFDPKEPVKLILKTVAKESAVPVPKSQYPNIEVIRGRISAEGLNNLLGRAHCMVYPSRGEGFGITPLEAMATGLPAIVPNEHGISEYYNHNYMIPVKATERCPGLYNRFKEQDVGEMVVADIKDLRKKMRYAYNNQKRMNTLGKKASQYVSENYTYAHTAKNLKEILDKWQDADVEPRKDEKYLRTEAV